MDDRLQVVTDSRLQKRHSTRAGGIMADRKKDELNLPMLYRYERAEVERADTGEGEPTEYEVSFSSEFAVPRWFGKEILSHKRDAVDMTLMARGAAVKVQEGFGHEGPQVGVVMKGWIDSAAKRGRARVRFSRSVKGQEVEQDVADEVRIWTSVGYRAIRAKQTKRGEKSDENEWLVTRWQPQEITFVSVPADPTVGAGRDAGDDEDRRPVEIEGGERSAEGDREMGDTKVVEKKVATTETPPAATGALEVRSDHTAERKRAAEIFKIAESNGMTSRAAEWVESGISVGEVGLKILEEQKTKGRAQPAPEHTKPDGPDLSTYSYTRAIRCAMDSKFDGIEGEQHTELVRSLPDGYQGHGGILVPLRTRSAEQRAAQRALDSQSAAAGAETVFDRPGEMIELLRNRTVVINRGARLLTGLTAPVPFAKQTGAATAYWVGENPGSNVTETNLATGIVTLAPKTLQATSSYSRQLIILSSEDVEAMVRDDLAAVHSLEIDRVAIHGLGADGEPIGVYNATDVQVKAMGGVPDFVKAVNMVGLAADKNADLGSLGWITTPLMAAVLMTKPRISSAAAGFIWDGTVREGTMAGYPASASNQVSKTMESAAKHGMIFGNWSDMLIGLWGAMEVVVDPFALKKQGMIEVTTFQMADVMIRHGQSFVKATGATIV